MKAILLQGGFPFLELVVFEREYTTIFYSTYS